MKRRKMNRHYPHQKDLLIKTARREANFRDACELYSRAAAAGILQIDVLSVDRLIDLGVLKAIYVEASPLADPENSEPLCLIPVESVAAVIADLDQRAATALQDTAA